jgi:hypothetical protein
VGEERGEIAVAVDSSEFVAQASDGVAVGQNGVGHAEGVSMDGRDRFDFEQDSVCRVHTEFATSIESCNALFVDNVTR